MELPVADETGSKLNWNDKNLRYNHREDTMYTTTTRTKYVQNYIPSLDYSDYTL